MGTQHARRVVVKKNTSTENLCNKDTFNNTDRESESSVNKISGLHKHAQQQLNGLVGTNTNSMHVGVHHD